MKLTEQDITVDQHQGVVFKGCQIKIYVNDVTSIEYGKKVKEQILTNQYIVDALRGRGLSFLESILSTEDFGRFKILFDEKSIKILEYLAKEE